MRPFLHAKDRGHVAVNQAPGIHPKEGSQGNLPVTQPLFQDFVRKSHGPLHPEVAGEGEGGRRRMEREQREAQCDAGDGKRGGDILEAEGSGD